MAKQTTEACWRLIGTKTHLAWACQDHFGKQSQRLAVVCIVYVLMEYVWFSMKLATMSYSPQGEMSNGSHTMISDPTWALKNRIPIPTHPKTVYLIIQNQLKVSKCTWIIWVWVGLQRYPFNGLCHSLIPVGSIHMYIYDIHIQRGLTAQGSTYRFKSYGGSQIGADGATIGPCTCKKPS